MLYARSSVPRSQASLYLSNVKRYSFPKYFRHLLAVFVPSKSSSLHALFDVILMFQGEEGV